MSKLFENISRTEIEHLIREWIHNQRDRDVVSRRLLDGIVFEELADEFALSVTQGELLRLIEVGASCFNHYCVGYDYTYLNVLHNVHRRISSG